MASLLPQTREVHLRLGKHFSVSAQRFMCSPFSYIKQTEQNLPVELKTEQELEATVYHSWTERMLNPELSDQK